MGQLWYYFVQKGTEFHTKKTKEKDYIFSYACKGKKITASGLK